jgi:hypothetical protein
MHVMIGWDGMRSARDRQLLTVARAVVGHFSIWNGTTHCTAIDRFSAFLFPVSRLARHLLVGSLPFDGCLAPISDWEGAVDRLGTGVPCPWAMNVDIESLTRTIAAAVTAIPLNCGDAITHSIAMSDVDPCHCLRWASAGRHTVLLNASIA